MSPLLPSELLPGDTILYSPINILDWIIAIKTWSYAIHSEIYAGNGRSFASRPFIGIRDYPLQLDNIVAVRRPKAAWNFESAKTWFFAHAIGQKYDWKGILCFILAVKQGAHDRMFCSEFNTRFYNRGHFQPFDPNWDADKVAPSFFLITPAMETVWEKKM